MATILLIFYESMMAFSKKTWRDLCDKILIWTCVKKVVITLFLKKGITKWI